MGTWLRSWGITFFFFAMAACIVGAYVHKTPYDSRAHDLDGHLEHVDYVYAHWRVPPARKCWECYQPPAYYVLAAATLAATHARPAKGNDRVGSPEVARENARTLQWLSGVLALATLGFALLALRAVAATPYELAIASALVVLWPTFTTETCKIGNDVLVYCFGAASLWLLAVWQKTERASAIVLAAVAAGIALNAKLNGAVSVLLVLAMVAARALRPPRARPRLPRGVLVAVGVLVVSAGVLADTVLRLKHGHLGNGSPDVLTRVPNHLANFVNLDLASFRGSPWAYQSEAVHGRDYFWNYLVRTSLFDEYRTSRPELVICAYWLLACTAALLPFAVRGVLSFSRAAVRRTADGRRTMLVALLGWVSFAVAFRAKYPYVSTNDFRYILLAVVPVAAATGAGAGAMMRRFGRRHVHLAALAGGIVVVFGVASLQIVLDWS